MKRILLVLLVAAAIIGMTIYAVLRTLGPANPATFLPADTVLYAALPDLPRTALRWPRTSLAELASDPEVKAFLEKPLAKLGEQGQGEAGSILMGLKPGRIFLAVTEVTERGPEWVIGFQFFGGEKDLDHALDRLRGQLDAGATPATPEAFEYEGAEVVATQHGGLRLYSSSHGKWGFLSGSESGIKGMLDRVADRVDEPMLEEDALYREVIGKVSEAPDYLAFVRVQPVLDLIRAIAAQSGAREISGQMQQLEQIEAAAFSGMLEKGGMRETLFWKLSEEVPEIAPLDHATLRFTTPETIGYLAAVQQPGSIDSQQVALRLPPGTVAHLEARGLNPEELPDLLGNEMAAIVDWPDTHMKPVVVVAWEISDPDRLAQWIEGIAASTLPSTDVSEDDHARYYSFPSLQNTLFNPTIALTENFLLAGLDPASVRTLAERSGKETVVDSPAFKSVAGRLDGENLQLGFIDTASAFSRAYDQLKPVAMFGVAMMPAMAEYIDPGKLPETSTIAGYLSPITLTLEETGGGYRMESEGPVTFFQLFGGGGAAAMGYGWAQRQQQ